MAQAELRSGGHEGQEWGSQGIEHAGMIVKGISRCAMCGAWTVDCTEYGAQVASFAIILFT
jgi:hypothetical protein